MKKIAAIFLFFIMILCSAGLYISYKLTLHNIHLRQREVILHSDIFKHWVVQFSFPTNYSQNKDVDLVFVEKDEIMFDGKMYDIVDQYQSADSIFIKCIPDKIEDDVRDAVNNQIDNTEGATTQKNFSAFKFNPGPFTSGSETGNLYLIPNSGSPIFLSLDDAKPEESYVNVPSPPPWTPA